MSQAGIVDIEGSHPQIPTTFVTNSGTAIPIANSLEILGTAVAAHSIPLETVASGNTITIQAQYTLASASSSATQAGLASFNSADFSVDANGFVTLSGSAVTEFFAVDTSTVPGTNPVVPSAMGVVTITGGQVAAGTIVNVIRTDSLAANTYTIQIQRSQAIGSSTIGDNGVSHFNSAYFSVDANGFVSLAGLTAHAVLVGAGAAAITKVGPSATSGQIFQSQGSTTDPAFSTATYPATTTINQILYSSSANVVAGLATANNGVLIASGAGIPGYLAAGTNTNVLTMVAGAPAWASPATSGTVTTVSVVSSNGFAGTVANASSTPAITLTTSQTGLLSGNGTAITGTAITQYNVLTAGASNAPNSVAPSATSGVPLISQGSSSQPIFGTANVPGGGTGAATLTGVLTGNGTSAVTANAVTQHGVVIGGASNAVGSTSVGATGTVLIGNTGTDPTFSATPSVTSITLGSGSALGTYIQAGSWTPILAFGGLSTGITYSFQAGEYTQIGNVVYFSCLLVLSNVGSATGAASIGGLPVSIGNYSYGSIQQPNNLAFTATYNEAYWVSGGIGLGLTQFGSLAATPYSTNAVLTNANFINNTNLQFSGFYFTT